MNAQTKIALVGNPNSGKTTLFNALTGSRQYVGNWPGVTVEKKEGKLKKYGDAIITDLPGIYSLSPYSPEEIVARNYLIYEKPDAILNIIDGTNLERNLYLTTQLTELNIPVVLAVNMMDLVNKSGDSIDIKALSDELGCEILEVSALKGKGMLEATEAAIKAAYKGKSTATHRYSAVLEGSITRIEKVALEFLPEDRRRFFAVKLFERDENVLEKLKLRSNIINEIEAIIRETERELDDDSVSLIINDRYNYISELLKGCYKKNNSGIMTASDKIDNLVTNRWLALPIFALVMFLIYSISIGTIGALATDWVNEVLFGNIISPAVESWLLSINTAGWLVNLVVRGIIGGVSAVLGFVPQLLILFFMLSILEDIGYMSRVAFIMDRIFRRFGLSGKSFIPMLISSGCSVPGVMASRTIENDRDRRMTIMTTCFVPCSAKMPIIGLFAGALFGGSGLVAVSAYFIGISAIVISGIILKKTSPFSGKPSPFVMELPPYHVPGLGNILRSTWERGWSFIKKAGTVILLASIVLWFLQGFGFTDGSLGIVEDNNNSLLASIGGSVAFIFAPLGFGTWQSTVATFTGLIAKESIVSTFGVLFRTGEKLTENSPELWTAVATHFTAISAYSFMIFNLLCAPCFAAVGAIKKEMNSTKWTMGAIAYMTGFAYAVSLIVFQFGAWFIGGGRIFGTLIAAVTLSVMVYMLFRPFRINKIPRLDETLSSVEQRS